MSGPWALIEGVVQSYDWGRPAEASLVAKLAGRQHESGRFAELWFGDHHRGAARICGTPTDIREIIKAQPEKWLGTQASREGLPFLFKVLSIDRAAGLSLQIHPRRAHVEQLISTRPTVLTDAGVKAEMGIAQSIVKLFLGVKPAAEIARIAETRGPYIPFKNVLDQSLSEKSVASFFSKLLLLEADAGRDLILALVRDPKFESDTQFSECLHRLRAQYGDEDPGLRILPFLNLVTLYPGEGIFIEPGTVHAYLEGELVECMVSSDNVLRAGLTRKEVHRDIVAECTVWNPQPVSRIGTIVSPISDLIRRFDTLSHTREFVVDFGEKVSGSFMYDNHRSPALLVVTDGQVRLTGESGGEDVGALLESGKGALIAADENRIRVVMDDATAYLVSVP